MSTSQNSEENTDVSHESKDEAQGTGGEISNPTSPTHIKSKVDVLLKPAGDAPIMKKKKWAVERNKKVAYISDFIKKFIKMGQNESIFLYVNQSFSPSPDTEVILNEFGFRIELMEQIELNGMRRASGELVTALLNEFMKFNTESTLTYSLYHVHRKYGEKQHTHLSLQLLTKVTHSH